MNISGQQLDALYERYGFKNKRASPNLRAYTIHQGYFHAAELVSLAPNAKTDADRRELQDSGYAVTVRNFFSLQEAEETLFSSFFRTKETALRLEATHTAFAEKQTRSLGGAYRYVPCPFTAGTSTLKEGAELIDEVANTLNKRGPQLILIEAAAGFGKTCTAYEILRNLVTGSRKRLPIFYELSRDRQARVFRHVLLDEIDRNYPSLNSKLVQSEIQSGKVPLIIDGFDELLQKPSTPEGMAPAFEEVENMLDTIGDLLRDEAKVIITTRKTAIFAGDFFHRWMSDSDRQFNLTRFSIQPPQIADWLGHDRAELLKRSGLPVAHIANPVLLSFLRTQETETFKTYCEDPELIISNYFHSMLEREQERQGLRIPPEAQLKVFRSLARDMVEYDIASDDRDFIKALIADRNKAMLEKVRATYPPNERPKTDELASTLAGHALLDRVGRNEESVGFINDFVFGTLIGDSIITEAPADFVASEHMLNLAITAYSARKTELRQQLWGKLEFATELLDPSTQLTIDARLCGRLTREFSGATFEGMSISDCTIGTPAAMRECTFIQCTFRNVSFAPQEMRRTGFLECLFIDCEVIGDLSADPCWVLGCKELGCTIIDALGHHTLPTTPTSDSLDYEREVLEKFWPRGRPNAGRDRSLRTLLLGHSTEEHPALNAAIASLRRRELIFIEGDYARLNTNEMGRIMQILGRSGTKP